MNIKLLATILGLCSLTAYAQPTDLQSRLSAITSMQANFKQSVYNENQKLLQSFTGQMEFKKPNSFRWEVLQPDPSLLVTNGKKLWNYDASLEQVTVQKYEPNKEVTPISFILDNPNNLTKNFSVEPKANDCFKLTPKEETANFATVEVCFKALQITSVSIQDHMGQNTVFEFTQVKNNLNLAEQRFSFKPPAGVDVVGE